MLDDLVMTQTETEKIGDAFRLKYLKVISGTRRATDDQDWIDYLDGLEGAEYVRRFSDRCDPLDHLLESINNRLGERFVIRDPHRRDCFIILEKELAQKVLVLGNLP